MENPKDKSEPYSEPDTTPLPDFTDPGMIEDGNPQDIPPGDPEV